MNPRDHLSITMINDKIKKICKEGASVYDTRDTKTREYKVRKVYAYHVSFKDNNGYIASFTNSEVAMSFEKFDKEEDIIYRKEVG